MTKLIQFDKVLSGFGVLNHVKRLAHRAKRLVNSERRTHGALATPLFTFYLLAFAPLFRYALCAMRFAIVTKNPYFSENCIIFATPVE
jgi:hypothetical protein